MYTINFKSAVERDVLTIQTMSKLDSPTPIIWCECCIPIQISPEHQHAFQTCRLASPAPHELVSVIGILALQGTNSPLLRFRSTNLWFLPLSKTSSILLQTFSLLSQPSSVMHRIATPARKRSARQYLTGGSSSENTVCIWGSIWNIVPVQVKIIGLCS